MVNTFCKIIDKIIITKNFYSSQQNKTILLNNFTNIKSNIQNILLVKLEKYRQTTLFIIITDKYDSVHSPIRSRSLCIRIPVISNKEKRVIVHSKIPYQSVKREFYDAIYDIHDEDTIQTICDLSISYENQYMTPYYKICDRIINIYQQKLNKTIYKDLRDISYYLIKCNLSINYFYFIFLSMLLQKEYIRDKIKCKIINYIAESQYNYIKSYRSIIVLESLLFNIYALVHPNLTGYK